MPKHFRDLEKMLVGGVMPKYFGLEKCWGGGYANKFMDLKNVGGVMPKYFRDLKKNVGGEGHNCQFWSCSLILRPEYFSIVLSGFLDNQCYPYI